MKKHKREKPLVVVVAYVGVETKAEIGSFQGPHSEENGPVVPVAVLDQNQSERNMETYSGHP